MTTTTTNPRIVSVATALPEHYATQDEILSALKAHWAKSHFNLDRLEAVHKNTLVVGRHLALPIGAYEALDSFQKRNDVWLRVGLDLAERVARQALEAAGLRPQDIDHIFFVSVTGLATPSLDARLANRLGFRSNLKRTPIFGLGCVAGASGVARAADYLRAFPGQRALLVSVELCSLTMQQEDASIANIIASGLFGDGAAAVVLAADAGPGAGVLGSHAALYPDTERVMGWDVVDTGLKIVLSGKVPELARAHVQGDVAELLGAFALQREQIQRWVVHTGGPKVLEAFTDALGLQPEALAHSWASLTKVGNLSSASVLFVLAEHMREAQPGERGVLLAMGPGFCAEMALLQW